MTTPVYRSSMADLITFTRRRIGDLAGASQQFTDLEVQERLDETRLDIMYEELSYPPDLQYNGTNTTVAWDRYFSNFQFWETGWALQDGKFFNLTPLTSDELNGVWTFTSTPPGQYPPVFVTGKVYDCFSAAAELLDEWNAILAGTTFNFATGGQTFNVGQILDNRAKLAAQYRRKARPKVAVMYRDDITTSHNTAPQRASLEGNPNAFTY